MYAYNTQHQNPARRVPYQTHPGVEQCTPVLSANGVSSQHNSHYITLYLPSSVPSQQGRPYSPIQRWHPSTKRKTWSSNH
ncbi:hypothetical protein E2C01_031524 [Portunus trituberculatus]|uniref:Uncharacterized protein n=1 Tax=Portunus trituberculatus TaxID=210409 RepID=A0A5B7F0A6_PORTR|nr:hypothetical protein [Portunus trituberculatus]